MSDAVEERRIEAFGMTLAARHWRKGAAGGQLPVIAVHGWLDNAVSFDALAGRLTGFEILALDLPGHGRSDHKHQQGSYNIWDDHLQILAVADACGWDRFILIGHSRGAMICTLLAAAMPDRVAQLVCLDGFLPPPNEAAKMPRQLGRFLQDYLRADRKPLREFQSVEDAIAARARSVPTCDASARKLLERGLDYDGRVYRWSSDRRLTFASAVKLTAAECDAVLDALIMPVLLILAPEGYPKWAPSLDFEARNPNIRQVIVGGSHHQHMEAEAVEIAERIAGFIGSAA